MPAPKTNKGRKYLLLLLKVLVSGSLLFLILRKSGLENVLESISSINPLVFLGAVGLYIMNILISSFRWRLLIISKPSVRRLFSLYLMGSFFSIALPGIIGGDAVKGYYLYKETGDLPESMASIFMERYLGFSGLFIVGALAYPFALPYLRGAGFFMWIFPLFFFAFILGSVVFFKLKAGKKRIKLLGDFYRFFDLYTRKTLFKGFFYSLGVQLTVMLAVFLLSRGLGQTVSFPLFFVFMPMIIALSVLPVSISGLGIREASFVILFGSVGLGPDNATALSFTWFLSSSAGSLLGLLEYLRWKKTAPIKKEI